MKKGYKKYPVKSAEYVVSHAAYRRTRGKKGPTVSFSGIRNPKVALCAATEEVINHPGIPDTVVYYNKWTAFDDRAVANLFTPFSFDYLKSIEPGVTVWVDSEQPQGKVYGYDRVMIVSVTKLNGVIRIEYEGRFCRGTAVIEKKGRRQIFFHCLNPVSLLELATQNPLVSEVGSALRASMASRQYLEEKGFSLSFAG